MLYLNWLEIKIKPEYTVSIFRGDNMNNHYSEQDQILLNEILPEPSSEIICGRFDKQADAADCTGKCISGKCQAIQLQ